MCPSNLRVLATRGRWVWLCAFVPLLVAACQAQPTENAEAPLGDAVPFEDCHLSSPTSDSRVAARCAHVEAPLNHLEPDPDETLALKVAVLPAVSRSPEADAVVYLSGGPGQSALESFPQVAGAFREINHRRDLLLVDQRGTGGSGRLDCPEPEDADASDASMADSGLEDLEELTRWASDCAASLGSRTDLRRYTTADAVEDLEWVRSRLGYPQLSVYGISYGTRLAQAYAAAYPDRVRILILDGVVAGDPPLGTAIAYDADLALDAILERCRLDTVCNETFGDLETDVSALRTRLEAETVAVELPHPVTGETTELMMSWPMVAFGLRFASYAPETVSLIPLILDEAAEGELAPLAALYLQLSGEVSSSMSSGLHYAVVCSEDLPRFEPDELKAANEGSYLGDQVSDALDAACAEWPTDLDEERRERAVVPTLPDVPSLLLSGENDPVTPPRHAEKVAELLPRSLHVVGPGQGHGIVQRGCVPELLTDFVEAGSLDEIDGSCVQELKPAAFFLDFSGPAP